MKAGISRVIFFTMLLTLSGLMGMAAPVKRSGGNALADTAKGKKKELISNHIDPSKEGKPIPPATAENVKPASGKVSPAPAVKPVTGNRTLSPVAVNNTATVTKAPAAPVVVKSTEPAVRTAVPAAAVVNDPSVPGPLDHVTVPGKGPAIPARDDAAPVKPVSAVAGVAPASGQGHASAVNGAVPAAVTNVARPADQADNVPKKAPVGSVPVTRAKPTPAKPANGN